MRIHRSCGRLGFGDISGRFDRRKRAGQFRRCGGADRAAAIDATLAFQHRARMS